MNDAVDHPVHYTAHPSGVECIEIVEWLPFNVGNAIKYVWRAGLKDDAEEDHAKAIWYLERAVRSGPEHYIVVSTRAIYLASLVVEVEDKRAGLKGGEEASVAIQRTTLLGQLLRQLVAMEVQHAHIVRALRFAQRDVLRRAKP